MNKYISRIYRLLYVLRMIDAMSVAKKLGVKCGETCRILDDPTKVFGSEPYLVTLGNHVEITNGARIITHDGGMWVLRTLEQYKKIDCFGPVKIGNNVFVGSNAIILPGVTIGDNVVIGAGSVVAKDIPADTVAAGVPACPIKSINEYMIKANIHGITTKGLNAQDKEMRIRQLHPEWFSSD